MHRREDQTAIASGMARMSRTHKPVDRCFNETKTCTYALSQWPAKNRAFIDMQHGDRNRQDY